MSVLDEELFRVIADGAEAESPLWGESLRPDARREPDPVFSRLVPDERFVLGLETIYEGYLLHYGRPRLFDPPDDDVALLLGDALLAHGLVRIAETGATGAVADLGELLALCAQGRADGAAWAATAALRDRGGLDDARQALRLVRDPAPLEHLARATVGDGRVDEALAAHSARLR